MIKVPVSCLQYAYCYGSNSLSSTTYSMPTTSAWRNTEVTGHHISDCQSHWISCLECLPYYSATYLIWQHYDLGDILCGFLCSSELTVPSQGTYDPSTHLSVNDVAVDNLSSPTMVQVRIKQSKTDPFCQGVNLYLGKTDTTVCPVTALCHTFLCKTRPWTTVCPNVSSQMFPKCMNPISGALYFVQRTTVCPNVSSQMFPKCMNPISGALYFVQRTTVCPNVSTFPNVRILVRQHPYVSSQMFPKCMNSISGALYFVQRCSFC